MMKATTRICNVLSFLIGAFTVSLAVLLLGPRLFGYDTYTVLSGSMEPAYHIGSIVYVDTKIQPEAIKPGDPVTFYLPDGQVATHRVEEISTSQKEFITKGDANEGRDLKPVSFANYIGRAGKSLPYLGYLSLYLKTIPGILSAAILFLLLILLNIVPQLLGREDKGNENA